VLCTRLIYRTVSQTDNWWSPARDIILMSSVVEMQVIGRFDEFSRTVHKSAYAVGQSAGRNGARNWRLLS